MDTRARPRRTYRKTAPASGRWVLGPPTALVLGERTRAASLAARVGWVRAAPRRRGGVEPGSRSRTRPGLLTARTHNSRPRLECGHQRAAFPGEETPTARADNARCGPRTEAPLRPDAWRPRHRHDVAVRELATGGELKHRRCRNAAIADAVTRNERGSSACHAVPIALGSGGA